MRKQAAEVCLRLLGAILWSPSRGDIPLQMGLQGVVSCQLATEIKKDGAKLVLSEVRKQQQDGFSDRFSAF